MNVVYSLLYMVKYVSVGLLVGDLFLINFFCYYNLKYILWRIRKYCKKQDNDATI
jgi:hypothetical protein